MIDTLIKTNCETGEQENLFPVTVLQAVKDPNTGKTLDVILENINHIYLPFKDNSIILTRLQVPQNLRKSGLWITYKTCKGNIITEWYNNSDYSDDSWCLDENWTQYIYKELVEEIVDDILSWYKA